MFDFLDYQAYQSARAANRTNELLQEQNRLLNDLRRQSLSPQERAAEDAALAGERRAIAQRRKKEADAAERAFKSFAIPIGCGLLILALLQIVFKYELDTVSGVSFLLVFTGLAKLIPRLKSRGK
jgi:hypothetical protein